MGLSKLTERCRRCNKAGTCNNKRMEEHGFLVPCPEHRHDGLATNIMLCDDLGHDTVVPITPEYEAAMEKLREGIARATQIPYSILFGQQSN